MTLHNQHIPHFEYENQEYDPDIEEFQGLINPFVEAGANEEEHPDKDFEPRDPGWVYPDEDHDFDSLPIQKQINKRYGKNEIDEDQEILNQGEGFLEERGK